MRLLIISTPFTGHITPAFSMAKNLISSGHMIDCSTTEKWQGVIDEIGATLIPFREHKKLSSMIINAYKMALLIGNQYDGIIYDELFFPGRILGATLGVPAIRYFPCIAINRQIMERLVYGSGFMGIFRSPFIRRRWTRGICRNLIPGISDWTEEAALNPPECNIVFAADCFQPHRNNFQADKYFFAGPSIWNSEDINIEHWLQNTGGPVVYVSLGTIDNKQVHFYRKCLEAFRNKEAQFIISVGSRIPVSSLGNIPKNCAVYSTNSL